MKVVKKMCKECPFRRTSAQGYLGNNKAEPFAHNAMLDHSVACHMSMRQELPREEWERLEREAPRCRGALTMMRNTCKLPRDPEMSALVKTVEPDRVNVFSQVAEFIQYHSPLTKSRKV